jgi:hypothetical protein
MSDDVGRKEWEAFLSERRDYYDGLFTITPSDGGTWGVLVTPLWLRDGEIYETNLPRDGDPDADVFPRIVRADLPTREAAETVRQESVARVIDSGLAPWLNHEATRKRNDMTNAAAERARVDAMKDGVWQYSEKGYDGFKVLSDGQLMIGRKHDGWALLSMSNFWGEPRTGAWGEPTTDALVVLYAGLQSRAAAEVAMSSALSSWFDEVVRHPLGYDAPGDNPVQVFNDVGRILTVLREAEDPPEKSDREALMSVAYGAYRAMKAEPLRAAAAEDIEDPFDEDI